MNEKAKFSLSNTQYNGIYKLSTIPHTFLEQLWSNVTYSACIRSYACHCGE